MKKRRRPERVVFYVTPEEKELIHAKMDQLGTGNMGAYLRKIAIDGYVVNLDVPELRQTQQVQLAVHARRNVSPQLKGLLEICAAVLRDVIG